MSLRLSRSLRMKLLATAIAAVGFVLLYERGMFDSRTARIESASDTLAPAPGASLRFDVTSYCKGEVTASGVKVRAGIAAADPQLLPPGSVVRIEGIPEKYEGIYTVLDTGPEVQGRELDIYMWSCFEALDFGRRKAAVTVVRLGWDPKASAR
jgi:3D (Asp-Asp-Asp) domain-containing protein